MSTRTYTPEQRAARLERSRRWRSDPSGKWCECGEPAQTRLFGDWVCLRCYRMDKDGSLGPNGNRKHLAARRDVLIAEGINTPDDGENLTTVTQERF